MRIAVFAAIVVAIAGLNACVSPYSAPRMVRTRTDFVDGYTPGMTVETPTMIVTSPPENNGSLWVDYRGGNSRGTYNNGGRWIKQYGSTDPDWWIK